MFSEQSSMEGLRFFLYIYILTSISDINFQHTRHFLPNTSQRQMALKGQAPACLGRQSYVSKRGLSGVLSELKDLGILSDDVVTSRQSVKRAREDFLVGLESVHGALIKSMETPVEEDKAQTLAVNYTQLHTSKLLWTIAHHFGTSLPSVNLHRCKSHGGWLPTAMKFHLAIRCDTCRHANFMFCTMHLLNMV